MCEMYQVDNFDGAHIVQMRIMGDKVGLVLYKSIKGSSTQ